MNEKTARYITAGIFIRGGRQISHLPVSLKQDTFVLPLAGDRLQIDPPTLCVRT